MNLRFLILCSLAGGLAGIFGSLFHIAADGALSLHITWAEGLDGPVGGYAGSVWDRINTGWFGGTLDDRLARGWDWLDTDVFDGALGPRDGNLLALQIFGSAILSIVMLALAIWLVHRFSPEAGGSGIPEVEGAIGARLPLRWHRVLPVKFLGGILSIGSGAVVGREGPTIHIGASISEWLGEMARLDGSERRGMIAAGAAAGLAAAFNAPVASVLFIMEETRDQFPYGVATVTGVILASIFSAIATGLMIGPGAMLPIDVAVPGFDFVYFALALGAVLGVFGLIFNRGLILALDIMQTRRLWARAVMVVVVGGALGSLLVIDVSTVEGGEGLITNLATGSEPIKLMIVLILARFLLTVASYGMGVPGGLFAPILALATCLGIACAGMAQMASWPTAVPSDASAVIAMAGLFAATVRAPMVGVVLTAELTGSFELFLPLLACAGAAHLVSEGLRNRPIYEVLLERRLAAIGTGRPPR
ncbi:MAG: H(+)/Cl(-) exchange transporter ClcA [Pseudomonadota bacterium]